MAAPNLVPRAFPLKVGGAGGSFPAPPTFKGKALGTRLGGSILGSIILHGTFRRKAHLWDNAHILKLENCLLCLSSIILQFFNFIHRMVFDFIFYYVTMNTLYKRLQTLISQQLCTQSLYSIHIQ